MQCAGFGGGWAGTKKLGLSFAIYRKVDKQEARAMLVDCMQEFISTVNSNEALRPYLDGLLFTEKNIRLDIFLKDSNNERIYYPNTCVFGSTEGDIFYYYKSPEKKYGYIATEYETFQEALSILEEENKSRTQDNTQIAYEDTSITQEK